MDKEEQSFIGIAKLESAFAFLDGRIRNCHLWAKDRVSEKEKLQKQKELFLQIANDLNFRDLKTVYYVRELSKRRNIFSALRRLYQAECAWKNTTQQTDEYKDPFD